MNGIEINGKYVRAFKFSTFPNGEPKWLVGVWNFDDNVVQHIYQENFKSKEEAQAFIANKHIESVIKL
tara:strand:+ start:1061 stop:1264 length:204 start_codon:yes stop_codon:yes gene_type:complete